MWNTILFDLDGTLTDSQEGIINAISYALDYMGVHMERGELVKFIGPPLMESLPEYSGFNLKQSEDAIERFREYYQARGWLENAPYPGVPALLRDLKAAGKELLVATSKPEAMAVQVLEHFGLAQYFESAARPPARRTAPERRTWSAGPSVARRTPPGPSWWATGGTTWRGPRRMGSPVSGYCMAMAGEKSWRRQGQSLSRRTWGR